MISSNTKTAAFFLFDEELFMIVFYDEVFMVFFIFIMIGHKILTIEVDQRKSVKELNAEVLLNVSKNTCSIFLQLKKAH